MYFFDPKIGEVGIVRLVDVTRQTQDGNVVTAKVLNFTCENNNFLDEFILRFNIGISHLVKVREGLAEGGVKISITYVLDMLSVLGTKYLLFGDMGFCSPVVELETMKMADRIFGKYNLKPKAYNLRKLADLPSWSDFRTGIYQVEYTDINVIAFYFMKHLGRLESRGVQN